MLQSDASKLEFAVVDCETTGLYNRDRIIEVAIVVLDSAFNVVEEYDTLVDPTRDLGPTHIHKITPAMMSNAPTFEEILPSVACLLHNRVIVSHNLPFDSRFLIKEFERSGGVLDAGCGYCTLAGTGERLSNACKRYGFELEDAHRALADARASANLLKSIFNESDRSEITTAVANPRNVEFIRTLTRDATISEGNGNHAIRRIFTGSRYPTTDDSCLRYLNLLDHALDDLVLTDKEKVLLKELQADEGLSADTIERLHLGYFDSMVFAAHRDGVVTTAEHEMLNTVADLLSISRDRVPAVTWRPSQLISIVEGTRVSFTGVAAADKAAMECAAASKGLQPVTFSKSRCDLLIAESPESQSGKAKKARDWDIPIMGLPDFKMLLSG